MDKTAQPLRILLVEDNPNDAELILRELRRAHFAPEARRVDTEAEYLAALNAPAGVDLILSDYAMPHFSGLRALELRNQRRLDIPFIIISGTIGEETAVAAIRSGAADYLLKDRLARLGQAVEQALQQQQADKERKQAEETLNKLRLHHELMLNSAGEGICVIDLDGNINFINPIGAVYLGWEVVDLLGKPAHATFHHTRTDGSKSSLQESQIHESMRAGATRRITNDIFWRKDGKSFRVDYVSAPIKDKRGQVTGTIVTFKDISEQFAAEQRLKLQEQRYRLLFQTNPSPMYVYNADTLQVLAVNDAAVAQYGYSRDEFLALTLRELRPAEDVDLLEKALSITRSPGQSSGEFRHVRKDGSLLYVEIYSSPVLWDTASARIVTAIDVTERKRTEERMREQADIIERAHDAVIVRNFSDDIVTVWNNGAEHLYGWSATEAIGQPMGELIFAESDDRRAGLDQLVSAGEFHGELKHCAKDGREVIVDSRVTLIRNDDGTPRAVLGINTDITEQKKLETQLLRAQRLESIGTLASGVAHDLNNILTPILMCAEVLRGEVSNEDRQSAVALIDQSARRGANVVKQVLTFARGVEGERVVINPRHLLEEMVDIARKTFPKSIEVTARYPEELWSVEGDPTQLHQVLLNLCVNARDAMPDGGALTLAAENVDLDESYAATMPDAKVGPHVLLRVSDTGTGMPRATIDKIFDPFFTTKQIGKGTGLGLSTALGIVKSHRGFLALYSEPGRGTTFRIFLPATGIEPAAVKPTTSQLVQGNNELILVIDDEEGIRRVTTNTLEKNNYRALEAKDGPEALALFAQQMDSIQLVITDLMLPYMDGLALARALTKMKPDIAIIASTGQGEQTSMSELQSLGVKNFLSKPYDSERLLRTVHEALAGARS
ncbi:MAG: hypothetical protein QOG48_795 [Verrucomicrobiota bacterium]|jgi:PAS domain S-box-containing protein